MQKNCSVCGILFTTPYPRKRYCGSKCSQKALNTTEAKVKKAEYMRQYWKNNPDKYQRLKDIQRKYPNHHKPGPLPHIKDCPIRDHPFEELSEERKNKILEFVKRQQPRINIRELLLDKECCVCHRTPIGNNVSLVLHHIRYNPEEKVTMCVSCHRYLHSQLEKRKKFRINYTKD